MYKRVSVIVFIILLYGIAEYKSEFLSSYLFTTVGTQKSPLGLPAIHHPKDNQPSVKKIALGRKLFMDRRLSHNNTISCAMCHVPEQGFTSNELETAVGIEGRSHRRNSPTIFNVGYYKFLFHDGRELTLEDQIVGPLLAFNEMGNPSVGHVLEKIKNFDDYTGLFEDVYEGGVTLERMSQAIAAYERTFASGNSRFDQWHYGGDKTALTKEERAGFEIFNGKSGCVACHTINSKTALFTDQSFHNTGIGWARNNTVMKKEYKSDTFPVQLAPGVIVQVKHDLLETSSEKPQNDVGRFEITENPKDSWKYKTPSLRNLAVSAPYMHDGSLSTLEDVVEFYNNGGDDNPSKDVLLKPLALTKQEKSNLVAFLKTITGDNVKQLEKEAREAFFVPDVY
jgi:cytochrome c peroxidase|tara:strand:- start:2000 stop:3187 length:1188 start_codon:yes stop_codon:yes gene_type:complete